MSDDLATFLSKTDAMLALADRQVTQIGKVYEVKMIKLVVTTTPGPNLQLPETEYYAVGRLRGGYTFDTSPVPVAARWDGGPYDPDGLGEVTWGRLEAQVLDQPLHGVAYLNNDVAYAYHVHYGRAGPPYFMPARPYRDDARLSQELLAQEARLEVMAET